MMICRTSTSDFSHWPSGHDRQVHVGVMTDLEAGWRWAWKIALQPRRRCCHHRSSPPTAATGTRWRNYHYVDTTRQEGAGGRRTTAEQLPPFRFFCPVTWRDSEEIHEEGQQPSVDPGYAGPLDRRVWLPKVPDDHDVARW